jgi:hypothetical protein
MNSFGGFRAVTCEQMDGQTDVAELIVWIRFVAISSFHGGVTETLIVLSCTVC